MAKATVPEMVGHVRAMLVREYEKGGHWLDETMSDKEIEAEIVEKKIDGIRKARAHFRSWYTLLAGRAADCRYE